MNPMNEESNVYHAYLLRVWRAQCQGQTHWRASLESPHTGERQSFASLKQLFAFLSERCEGEAPGKPEVEWRDLEEDGHEDKLNGKE